MARRLYLNNPHLLNRLYQERQIEAISYDWQYARDNFFHDKTKSQLRQIKRINKALEVMFQDSEPIIPQGISSAESIDDHHSSWMFPKMAPNRCSWSGALGPKLKLDQWYSLEYTEKSFRLIQGFKVTNDDIAHGKMCAMYRMIQRGNAWLEARKANIEKCLEVLNSTTGDGLLVGKCDVILECIPGGIPCLKAMWKNEANLY